MTQPVRDAIGMMAAVVTAILVCWFGGTVAGLIHSGTAPHISSSEAPIILARTIFHLGDPAAAWPAKWQSDLPGAGGVYGGWVGVAMAFLALWWCVGAAWRLMGLRRRRGGSVETTKWAGLLDLRPLMVRAGQHRGRIVLGKAKGRLIAAEKRQSVLVAAPTQSGKTSGLVVPAILEWEGPVVATSVKGDLLDDTLHRRNQMGRVFIFDPTSTTGYRHSSTSPLASCGSWQQSGEVAHWLCSAARPGGSGGLQEAEFWYGLAAKLLAPILFACKRENKNMDDVVRILNRGEAASEEVLSALAGEEKAIDEWIACQGRDSKQLSSIYSTADRVVRCFADPTVARNTERIDFTVADLLDGKANTLYLVAPVHQQERLAPLFAMLIQQIIRVVYEIAASKSLDRAGGERGARKGLEPPMLLALDELANIAPIPDLEKIASTGAGQGLQLLTVVQDFAQLRQTFGDARAQTIVNNHRAKLFGAGLSDPDTLTYIQRVTGSGEFSQRSSTVGERHESKTEGTTFREITPANVVREQKTNEAVLIYGNVSPSRLKLRPWYKNRRLRRLAQERKV